MLLVAGRGFAGAASSRNTAAEEKGGGEHLPINGSSTAAAAASGPVGSGGRRAPLQRLRAALRRQGVTTAQLFNFMDSDRSDRLTAREFVRGLALAGQI